LQAKKFAKSLLKIAYAIFRKQESLLKREEGERRRDG